MVPLTPAEPTPLRQRRDTSSDTKEQPLAETVRDLIESENINLCIDLQNNTMLPYDLVTYMSCVEAFPTGIKIESSDQSPFWGVDQGIKLASELLKSTDQERGSNLTFDP